MLQSLQFIIGIFVILLILPQNPPRQKIEDWFWETGWFTSYQESKIVVKFLTIIMIILFFLLTIMSHNI